MQSCNELTCAFAADHVDRLGAPDLLLVRSADRSSDLVERELAVEEDAQPRLAGHLPDVERLCARPGHQWRAGKHPA
jgi:hypothetical protein